MVRQKRAGKYSVRFCLYFLLFRLYRFQLDPFQETFSIFVAKKTHLCKKYG